ncbi:MAG: efflux RND transporter periplasmic adaptor subunit [Calditrichaeota bacterium]|nr:MAG: efflux RND transporter periplasmic adaptor subunit [Calditrichota bacterium]
MKVKGQQMPEKRAEKADLSALRIHRGDEDGGRASVLRPTVVGLGLAALLVVVVFVYFFAARPDSAPAVEVATVTVSNLSEGQAVLTASGYVVAQRQAAIASKGTGRIEYLGVEEGDRVKKGQIIARLEHNDMDAALLQAKANLEVAKATLAQNQADLNEAKLNFERQKGLFEQHLISKSDYDLAEARYKSALAAVDAARARVQLMQAAVVSAEVDVENTNIRAPFDGTVLTKNADIGEMVAPFAASVNSKGAVVTIADMSSLEVEADVSEANIQRVKVGQPCEIILDAFPEHRYPGYVHKIVPTADRAKATVLTKIRFKELDEKVLPEMSAKVNFLSRADSAAARGARLTIPESAVRTEDGQDIVLVLRDHRVVETPVVLGARLGGRVEVKTGLTEGQRVVLHPAEELKTGTRVQLEQPR